MKNDEADGPQEGTTGDVPTTKGPDVGPESASEDQSTIDLPQPRPRGAAVPGRANPLRFEPGTLVAGRYRIVRFIGEGGMGEVYEAHDIELHESVALKTVRPEIATDAHAVLRFRREVHLARQVTHPNVARIFDIGHHGTRATEDGVERGGEVTFLSMELLSGETLSARLRREGRMTPDQALPLVAQMAAGLAAAHKAGVVHRDFKSANVMLVPSADRIRVVIADFGIARGVAMEEGTLTATGAMIGTPDYMAPEQVKGGTITAAADQYAFGIVMYEMVTGAKPFRGDTPLSSAVKRLSEAPPSLRIHVPDLDVQWEAAILRCLERDPTDRFENVLDVVKALEGEHVAEGRQARNVRAKWRLTALVGGAATLVLVGSVVAYDLMVPPSHAIESIAVLPFANVGGNPDAAYLSEGLTESLIDSLSRLPNLTVKSRNAVSRYQGPDTDAQKAGRELRVEAVLTGSVSPRAEDLSVGSELVDVSKGSHLWGERYDRKLADVLALQTEIVRQIAEKIRPTLSGEEAKRVVKPRTESPEAFQLYLKGRYSSNRHSAEGFMKGIDYLNRAVEADPSYALAWAGLSTCYYDASGLVLRPSDAMAKARFAAEQALKIDETVAVAHLSLALVLTSYDWNWQAAEKEFLRAIDLNPKDAAAHMYYGVYLIYRANLDKAVAEMTLARDVDPVTPIYSGWLAYLSYLGRRHDEAAVQYKKILEMDPTFATAHYTLGLVYMQQQKYPEAFDELAKAKADDPGSAYIDAILGQAYGMAGRHGEARRVLAELKSRSEREYVDPSCIALIYAGLGDNDQAFVWLDKAFEARSEEILALKVEPRYDSLRSDPRLAALIARAGL